MSTKATDTKKPQFPFGFAVPGDAEKYMLVVPHIQAMYAYAVLEQQREALSFLMHRCTADLQLLEKISGAGDLNGIYQAMAGFYEGAAKEYSAEAGKVMEMGSRAAKGAMQGLRQEAEALSQPVAKNAAAAAA